MVKIDVYLPRIKIKTGYRFLDILHYIAAETNVSASAAVQCFI